MSNDIKELRERINKINIDILDLLNLRTTIVDRISAKKDELGIEYFDLAREQEMLTEIIKQNQGPLPNEYIKEIFQLIFMINLRYMGINRERKLLVSHSNDNKFNKIDQMFDCINDKPIIIAGPCAVENYSYLDETASFLAGNNIKFLRGGAYKPRTSPYDFQGLKLEGLKILHEVGAKHNLITISEVVDVRDIETLIEYVDILQIGARNMQNYELLKEIGHSGRPVILKRGLSATIQEFIFAAEYIAVQGNRKIILCERGIRTFENKTRNTLDISAIPIIKKETCLPIIVDLSHSLGRKDIVNPIAKASLAAGSDGIMVEVHPYPEVALSDSKQQLNIDEFKELINYIR